MPALKYRADNGQIINLSLGEPGPAGPPGPKGDPGPTGPMPTLTNNLTSTSTTSALTAAQGKVLRDTLEAWSSLNAAGSGAQNVNTIDRATAKMFYRYNVSTSGSTGLFPTSNNANALLTINTHAGDYYHQLGFSSNGLMYHRNGAGNWGHVYTSTNRPPIGGFKSLRDFTAGTLIRTNITGGDGPAWLLEIKANTYQAGIPAEIRAQGYMYGGGIINHGAVSMGGYIVSAIQAFSYNGKLCFWFPRHSYWQGFTVSCTQVTGPGDEINEVVAIENVAKPSGISKEVTISVGNAGGRMSVSGTTLNISL